MLGLGAFGGRDMKGAKCIVKNAAIASTTLCGALVLCVGSILGDGLPTAEPEKVGVSTIRLKEMNAAIQKHIDHNALSGVVTLVARHGRTAQLTAYGLMDIEARKPMRTDALFRIASMNKILTCAAALTLYEQGRFRLDDPASKYIPELKNLRVAVSNREGDHSETPIETVPMAREITVRDLFRHTAGFVYHMRDTPIDRLYGDAGFHKWNKSLKEFVGQLAEMPLAYQPGTRWEYSYSIDVLGYLIQVLSGQPLNEAVKERVFAPLRMNDTDWFVPPGKVERLTNYYDYQNGKQKLVEAESRTDFLRLPAGVSGGGGWDTGYGGVVTTASDFARFLQMILNRGELDGIRVLRPETVDLMVSDQTTDIKDRSFPVSGYGLGVGVETEERNPKKTRAIYWAGGPYNTCFWADLDRKMLGILLVQNSPWGHLGIIDEFNRLSKACAVSQQGQQEP